MSNFLETFGKNVKIPLFEHFLHSFSYLVSSETLAYISPPHDIQIVRILHIFSERVHLYLEVEMNVLVVPIRNPGSSDIPERGSLFHGRTDRDIRSYPREVRIERHVSVHSLEPYLVPPEYVEIPEPVVIGQLSLLHPLEIRPAPSIDDADDLSFRESLYGRSERRHDVPSVVDPVGRIPSVGASSHGDELVLDGERVSFDRRYILRIFPVGKETSCDIASERGIEIPVECLEMGEFFGNRPSGISGRQTLSSHDGDELLAIRIDERIFQSGKGSQGEVECGIGKYVHPISEGDVLLFAGGREYELDHGNRLLSFRFPIEDGFPVLALGDDTDIVFSGRSAHDDNRAPEFPVPGYDIRVQARMDLHLSAGRGVYIGRVERERSREEQGGQGDGQSFSHRGIRRGYMGNEVRRDRTNAISFSMYGRSWGGNTPSRVTMVLSERNGEMSFSKPASKWARAWGVSISG